MRHQSLCVLVLTVGPTLAFSYGCAGQTRTESAAPAVVATAPSQPPPASDPPAQAPVAAQPAQVVVTPEPKEAPAAEPEPTPRGARTRERGTRDQGTIFSPLPWPAGNRVRLASGAPGPDYWQQQVDYAIDASLNADSHEVTGHEVITYTNNSPAALDYIWMHMEQNIFRADSIGSYISGNTAIGMSQAFGNGYTIKSIRANGKNLEYHVYDTMARIDLDKAISPGGSKFVFEVSWSFTIPDHAFRRFGIENVGQGIIFEVAQWFPAVAVYDDVHGWNTQGYLGTGEFYTNFGNYDVSLTVPRSHIVAATGVLQNARDVFTATQLERLDQARKSDDTVLIRSAEEVGDPTSRPAGDAPLTWHYRAEMVRTFAWASSAAFIYDACNLDGVLVQSVYPKEALPVWGESTQMLRTSIAGYSTRWFKYPYPEATNVSGIEGGMEYPMIIFCGSRRSDRGLYGVTTHEIGHNWFPMTVNSDERRYAWMDEGFNTFINHYSTQDWFTDQKPRRGGAGSFGRAMRNQNGVPIMTYADQLPGSQLGSTQYDKPARGLLLLREEILGEERFDRAFREYINRWAFKSPQPADFFRTMEDVAGTDLAWFWRGWFYETSSLDQSIYKVDQKPREDESFDVTIELGNLDELVMPVALELTYDDGSTDRQQIPVEVWFSSNRYNLRFRSAKAIAKVVVDPDRAYPDTDRENNSWEAAPKE